MIGEVRETGRQLSAPETKAQKRHGDREHSGPCFGIAAALMGARDHGPCATPRRANDHHPTTLLGLSVCLTLIAALSSVDQAGASGFLAVMGLFGLAPETIKPTALKTTGSEPARWLFASRGRAKQLPQPVARQRLRRGLADTRQSPGR